MGNDILSQEEVDSLLRGSTEDGRTTVDNSKSMGTRSYDLGQEEPVVQGRPLPGLEVIHERFAQNLRIGLLDFLRRDTEISVGPVRIKQYSEFVHNVVVPTNLNVIQVKPFKGTALFILEPSLVFSMVDTLFGSDGRHQVRVEERDFTPTEQRIIRRVLDVAFHAWQRAWQPVCPVELVYLRSEMNTQFASIVAPAEAVITVTFNIKIGGGGGSLHICLPYSMVEPIHDILSRAVQIERIEKDPNWVNLMSRQVQVAEVELTATLAKTQVSLGQVLSLKEGDVVTLHIPSDAVVDVAGIPVFECRYGTLQGRYALRVEQVLSGAGAFSDHPATEAELHNE